MSAKPASRHFRSVLALAVAAACFALPAMPARALDEYQAKAIFLYKFATFVEWPEGALSDRTTPIALCVLGQSPLTPILDAAVRNKQVEGRGFLVRQVAIAPDVQGCHMLFVAGGSVARFQQLRPDLPASGLLVVGESDGFALDGGIINLQLHDGRLQVQINVQAAKQARLAINSRLLGMAELVRK